MPNHTNNNLTITGPTSDVLSFVSAVNHSDNPAPSDDSVNLYLGDGSFDFNAIVPMPKELVGTTSPSYIQTQQELDDMWNDFNRRKVGGQSVGENRANRNRKSGSLDELDSIQ